MQSLSTWRVQFPSATNNFALGFTQETTEPQQRKQNKPHISAPTTKTLRYWQSWKSLTTFSCTLQRRQLRTDQDFEGRSLSCSWSVRLEWQETNGNFDVYPTQYTLTCYKVVQTMFGWFSSSSVFQYQGSKKTSIQNENLFWISKSIRKR